MVTLGEVITNLHAASHLKFVNRYCILTMLVLHACFLVTTRVQPINVATYMPDSLSLLCDADVCRQSLRDGYSSVRGSC
jgi:hypothetical protein